ncbi:MAG TPA: hypothetical protein VJN21_00200 [Candidatus Acidoferrales bacterium]|nr:hypothetical protein [Candidatus Acidoferrales bacterium]
MLVAYRIMYGLVLAVFLGHVAVDIGEQPSATTFVLLVVAAVEQFSICGLLVRFSQTQQTTFWVLVPAWEAVFIWYAWFIPASPFVLHEWHALDAEAVARESAIHYLKAGAEFAVLFALFLSLPVARMAWKNRTHGE